MLRGADSRGRHRKNLGSRRRRRPGQVCTRMPNGAKARLLLDPIWTLRVGSCGTAMERSRAIIKHLDPAGRLGTARNALEVLAGESSWGFKSPSPHQISGFRINLGYGSLFRLSKTCPDPRSRRPRI